VSGSVRFQPEQISAVTDPGPEHFWPDRTNTGPLKSLCLPSYDGSLLVYCNVAITLVFYVTAFLLFNGEVAICAHLNCTWAHMHILMRVFCYMYFGFRENH